MDACFDREAALAFSIAPVWTLDTTAASPAPLVDDVVEECLSRRRITPFAFSSHDNSGFLILVILDRTREDRPISFQFNNGLEKKNKLTTWRWNGAAKFAMTALLLVAHPPIPSCVTTYPIPHYRHAKMSNRKHRREKAAPPEAERSESPWRLADRTTPMSGLPDDNSNVIPKFVCTWITRRIHP